MTVTNGRSGWFACLMWFNNEDENPNWEPYEIGIRRYRTREEAIAEAKFWAKNLGILEKDQQFGN